MDPVQLHRTTSRSWYSVGAVERVEDAVRFARERLAVGDETAAMMGGSPERFAQLQGRWLAVYRGKTPGLPLSDAARLRLWRSPAMRANHDRFVNAAAPHFDDLARDFNLGDRGERYSNFLSEWYVGLRKALGEWAWMRVRRQDVRRYLCGAAVREAKRAIRREYVARGAGVEDFAEGLEALLRRAREEGGEMLGLPASRYREVLALLRRHPERIRTQDDLNHAIEAAQSTRHLRIRRRAGRQPAA